MTTMDDYLDKLRAAAEPTRLRLLALCAQGELTVTELTQILGQSQPRVSRHLKLMVEAGLLDRFREGTWAFYRLAQGDAAGLARKLIEMMPEDDGLLGLDNERLKSIKDSRAETAASYFSKNAAQWDKIREMYAHDDDVAKALLGLLPKDGLGEVLDIGTGEMTTLVGLANKCFSRENFILSCDISLSRLLHGRRYANDHLSRSLIERSVPFVADFRHLPLLDNAVDMIISAHAIEPNEGREDIILRELVRVARRRLVLFEPCYRLAPIESQRRMEEHGYCRDIEGAIARAGGIIEALIPITKALNPLNQTFAFVVDLAKPPLPRLNVDDIWACPHSLTPIERRPDCYYAKAACLAYPVLFDIPILRRDASVVCTSEGIAEP